jgi:hypothetical protein
MYNKSEQEVRDSMSEIAEALNKGYENYRKELLYIANSQDLLKSYKVIIDEYLIKLKGLEEEFENKLSLEEQELIELLKKA